MAQPSLGNLGAKFSETHSLNLRLILHKLAIVSLRKQFKTFDSNNLLCLQCSLSKMCGP